MSQPEILTVAQLIRELSQFDADLPVYGWNAAKMSYVPLEPAAAIGWADGVIVR